MDTQATAPLPQYQCHKKVYAVKIKAIDGLDQDPIVNVIITPEEGFAPFQVNYGYVDKHKPEIGGYYVVYEDGYKSFSPAEAFESGYTKI